jgi:hypothetical protein
MMTRQHYITIAEAIRGTIMPDVARLTLINRLSYQFKGDNSNFDKAKFAKAATPTK